MIAADYIVLGIVAVCFWKALRSGIKKKGCCGGASDGCSGCCGVCSGCRKRPEEKGGTK